MAELILRKRRTVDPERARRYRLRTMTVPERAYYLSAQEAEQMEEWGRAWMYDREDPARQPPVHDWEARVRKYAKAQGFHPSFTVQEDHQAGPGAKIIRWERDR